MAKEFFKNLPSQETPFNASRWNGLLNGEEAMGSIVVDDITCKNIFEETENLKNITTAYNAVVKGNFSIVEGETYALSFDTNNNGGIAYVNENYFNWAQTSCDGTRKTLIVTAIVTGAYKNITLIKESTTVTTPYDISNVMLEKGDKSTLPYVPYKKIGYNETESMGEIVVDDITCKNKYYGSTTYGYVNDNGEWTSSNSSFTSNEYFEVNFSTNYVVSFTTSSTTKLNVVVYYDENKNFISRSVQSGSMTFTTPSNCKYVRLTFNRSEGTGDISKIQLEKGSVATNYVEHKEFSNKQIYSTSEQVIGEWFDKPLYRKCYSGNISSSTQQISDFAIDELVNYCGNLAIGNNQFVIGKSSLDDNNTSRVIKSQLLGGCVRLDTNESLNGAAFKLAIDYTKTTD